MNIAASRDVSVALRGRLFGPSWFDYALIGGGLSLVATTMIVLLPVGTGLVSLAMLPYVFLLSNAAHFAASTVRLYTKPGAYRSWPFLTMGFPLLALVVLSVCILLADSIGTHLQSLYLTWSPYHFAAQAYGLAVMYSYRSGCRLGSMDKKLLWWVAMLPFFYNFLTAPGVGLSWLLPDSILALPLYGTVRGGAHYVLLTLAFTTPILLFVRVWRGPSGPMPLISLLTVVTNGIWFLVLAPLDAFVYATIFHGLQYLAIVIVFHLKDQMSRSDNRHGPLYHVLWFYGACVILGYTLFHALPLAYVFAGFGKVESVLLVVAAINLHHFIVDGYIWRLKKTDSNYRVMESEATAPA
jgi:hypothetical protein